MPSPAFRFLGYLVPVALLLAGCVDTLSGPEKVRRADELTREGDYDEAISLYREHMADRLAITDRPSWENPYFYLLLIGDVQLGQNLPAQALATYQEAESHKVDPPLISDRYRAVGRWYEEHGERKKALEVLTAFRDRDSLLFDAMLDRIAKELTAEEEAAGTRRPTPGPH